jgi:hypothetical protein
VKPIHNFLTIGIFLIVAVAIMVLAGIRDESIKMNKFDCRMLIGGWHPDVPQKVVKQCQKGVPNDYSSKTNY